MSDGHAHAHDHGGGGGSAHGHSHAPTAASLAGDARAKRALWFALGLGSVVMVGEVVAGLLFGSLALLGDAAHMLTDVGAYAIALWAASIAARPPTKTATFGTGKVEILAALLNGATLLAASAWIVYEAIRRMIDPPAVDGAGMSIVATIGLIANVLVIVALMRSGSSSLNMRGALLHAAGDLLGSVAAVIAGVIVATTGFDRADSIVSLLLTALIAFSAWHLVWASVHVLLDVAPTGMDAELVGERIVAVDGVVEAHDVHVWTMTPGVTAASAHVRITSDADPNAILDELSAVLARDLHITHSTFQLRSDRGSVPLDAVPRMPTDAAIEWATDHVARARPDLSRGVISAAASAVALNLGSDGLVSPVLLSRRTIAALAHVGD